MCLHITGPHKHAEADLGVPADLKILQEKHRRCCEDDICERREDYTPGEPSFHTTI